MPVPSCALRRLSPIAVAVSALLLVPVLLTPARAEVTIQRQGDDILASVAGLELRVRKTGEVTDVRFAGQNLVASIGLEPTTTDGRVLSVPAESCQPLDVADTFGGKSILASGMVTDGGFSLRYDLEVKVLEDASVVIVAALEPTAAFQARGIALTALLPADAYAGKEIWYNPRVEAGGEPKFRPGFSVNRTLPQAPGTGEIIGGFTWSQFPVGEQAIEFVTEQGGNSLEDRRGAGTPDLAIVNIAPYPYPRLASGDQRSLLLTLRAPAPDGFTPSPTTREAQDTFEIAQALYSEGKHDRAIGKLSAFLTKFGTYREAAAAQYYLADSQYHLNDFTNAVQAYQTLVDRYPRSGVIRQARFRLGESLYRLKRFEEAQAAFDGLARAEGSGDLAAAASYWSGESLYNLARYDEAMAAYSASLTASDASKYAAYAHYSLGLCLTQLKREAEASERFRTVVEKYPQADIAAECQFRLAQSSATGGDAAQAAAAYRAFIDKNPNSPLVAGAVYGMALSQMKAGDTAAARAGFERVVKEFGTSEYGAESRARLADCLFLTKDYAGARDAYRGLVDAGGEPAGEARFWLARCYQELADSTAALSGLRAYLEASPKGEHAAEAQVVVGDLLSRSGDLNGARGAYEAAQAAGPSESVQRSAKLGLAWVRYQTDKTPEALADLQALAGQAGDTRTVAAAGLQGASQQVTAGDYAGALATLDKLDRASLPKEAVAQAEALRGQALAGTGAHDAAVTAFDTALAGGESPARLAALAGKARSLAALGRPQEAEPLLASLGAADAEIAQRARYDVGEAFLNANQPEPARRQFEAIVAGPETAITPFAVFGLGVVSATAGDHESAAKSFRDVLARFPKAEPAKAAKLQLGRSLAALGKADEATTVLAEAAAAGEGAGPEVLLELATVAAQAGKAAEAEAYLKRLMETNAQSPLVAEALFQLGEIAFARGDFPAALANYERIVNEFPDNDLRTVAHYKRAWALRRQERYAEALPSFEVAATDAAHADMAADAAFQAGYCLLQTQRFAEAGAALNACAEKDPKAPLASAARLLAGDAFRQAGDTAAAKAAFERVIADYLGSPEEPSARVGLAACEQAAGNHQAVIAALERIGTDRRDETEAQALCLRAISLMALERTEEALDTFERTAVLYSAFAEWAGRAQLGVGECEERLGRKDDARKSYQRVLDEFGETAATEAARARLAALGR